MSCNQVRRGLVSSTPQLWRRLDFDRKDHFIDLKHARTHLQNSGADPLDVRIRVPTGAVDTTSVASLLRDHVSRLRTLDVYARRHPEVESLISSIGKDQPAPILERINISVAEEYDNPDALDFIALQHSFYPAPRLTHLGLPVYPLPDKSTPLLATLKSLTLDAFPVLGATPIEYNLDFIEALPHLQHFTFKSPDVFSFNTTSRMDYPRIIPMPNLISADVSAPGCGLDILRIFHAPILTDVRFDGWRDEGYRENWTESLTRPISDSLHRLAERSPNIKKIELHHTRMLNPLEDYKQLFSDVAFPQLEVLRLDSTDILDGALEGSRGLKRLELHACEGVTGAGLMRFVEGRDDSFELFVDSCPGITEEDISALTKIVKVESK